MTDLERFFHRLVQTLAATDPARLRQPISLVEIRGSLLPYRTNRRALGLDTSEDYELVLMRLCAGEGGFACLSPEEVRTRFEQELASPNPQLAVLRELGDALVSLVPHQVTAALAANTNTQETATDMLDALLPELAPELEPKPEPEPTAESVSELPAAAAVRCRACGEALPGDRPVKFCPYCGTSQEPVCCSACGATLEPGWRFCGACGRRA